MLNGREIIYAKSENITDENIIAVVNDALAQHSVNVLDESYLYDYRRGLTPIRSRKKKIRPEICNRVSVNNANQVVTFKNGYFLTKPAFYVSRKADEEITEKVKKLNEIIYRCGKSTVDNKIVNWFHTVGLGVMFIDIGRSDNPVDLYALDPRSAFTARSKRVGNPPLFGVSAVDGDDVTLFDVWTNERKWTLYGPKGKNGSSAISAVGILPSETGELSEPNVIGHIPIIEYAYSEMRMSAFEPAIDIMDSIDKVESNRIDGIEQQIQNLIITTNVKLENGVTANDIRKAGMINLTSQGENKADFRVLTEVLDQAQTQVTLNDLYEQMYEKCGVPYSTHEGGSTSDNVGAVYLRSGWSAADTQARNTTDLFLESDRQFQVILLDVLRKKEMLDLDISDIELKIVRNDASNILAKCQAALEMKNLGLSPEIYLERSGLSNDPLSDIAKSPMITEVSDGYKG